MPGRGDGRLFWPGEGADDDRGADSAGKLLGAVWDLLTRLVAQFAERPPEPKEPVPVRVRRVLMESMKEGGLKAAVPLGGPDGVYEVRALVQGRTRHGDVLQRERTFQLLVRGGVA